MHCKQNLDSSHGHDIKFQIDHHNSNSSMIANVICRKKKMDLIGCHFKSGMVSFQCNIFTGYWDDEVDAFEYEFDCYSKTCCPCVVTAENANLTYAQKELLLCHWKLGISMHQIKQLMCMYIAKESTGKHSLMPTMIKSKFGCTSNCPVPKCMPCELAHAQKSDPQVVQQ